MSIMTLPCLIFHLCISILVFCEAKTIISQNTDTLRLLQSIKLNRKSSGRFSIRGGYDLQTGKFVLEHRNFNQSDTQKTSNLTLQDIYEIQGLLGEGGFATVRKAIHRGNRNVYAVKSIDICKIKSNKLDFLRNEISIMKMLDHPNVIKLYEIFEEESRLHLILEMCDGGDLFDFLMKMSVTSGGKTWSDGNVSFVWTEARLADLARKMLSAVAYLHQRGIAHRSRPPTRDPPRFSSPPPPLPVDGCNSALLAALLSDS